jgi:hypothetical protein
MRWFVIVLLSILLLLMAALGTQISPTLTLLCLLGVAGAIYWGVKSGRARNIEFDEKSITFDGNTYLLDHVSSIGWRASGGYVAHGQGMQGTAATIGAMAGHALSGNIYMQYGADQIVIIQGLHPNNVEGVYTRIVQFLEHFGHSYKS